MQAKEAVSRAELAWAFANIAAAAILLTVALAAIALYLSRRKSSDAAQVYFGLFCGMYALRLLFSLEAFRALFHRPDQFWQLAVWFVTVTITVPFGLFLYQLSGGRLKRWLFRLLVAQGAFAVLGVVAPLFLKDIRPLDIANSLIVLGLFVALFAFLALNKWRFDEAARLNKEVAIFATGFLVWASFIIYENIHSLSNGRQRSVEFLGFLVFVGCLGYVTVSRALAREEQLLAIHKELEIARRIQASILPKRIPKVKGVDIQARYLPMSAVAGDFYDFLVIDEARLGILVADVTGHGVPAALIASMLKVAFAGQAANADEPALVLDGLNRALCGKFEEHFVTAVYVYVDTERRMMRVSGAGHPPILKKPRGDGKPEEILENGLMLGIFPGAAYEAREITIEAGDRVLLCTDGIFEAANAAREEFGRRRCAELMRENANASAKEFTDELLGQVAKFSGTGNGRTQDDDLTLIAVDFE